MQVFANRAFLPLSLFYFQSYTSLPNLSLHRIYQALKKTSTLGGIALPNPMGAALHPLTFVRVLKSLTCPLTVRSKARSRQEISCVAVYLYFFADYYSFSHLDSRQLLARFGVSFFLPSCSAPAPATLTRAACLI
jgi:hypothetical protein